MKEMLKKIGREVFAHLFGIGALLWGVCYPVDLIITLSKGWELYAEPHEWFMMIWIIFIGSAISISYIKTIWIDRIKKWIRSEKEEVA